MSTWKRDAASGLVVLLPILLTLYVVYWLYGAIANIPFLEQAVPDPMLRVLLTLLVFVLLVFAIGYLMRTALGSILETLIDDLINRLPGLRVVYNASKMAIETALSGTDDLQKPVKIETWNGLRMTAFKTGRRPTTAARCSSCRPRPTSPRATSSRWRPSRSPRRTSASRTP